MEMLCIENAEHNRLKTVFRMTADGISAQMGENELSIAKTDMKHMEAFRGCKGICLRICTEEEVYDFANIHESQISQIRSVALQNYGIAVEQIELEINSTVRGNLSYSDGIVSFRGERQIFGIPKNKIKNITELENEIEFHLGDTEIVFNSASNIAQLVGVQVSEEICIVNDVSCLNPRSRSTLIFYKDYFILKGSSHDHTIFYNDIDQVLFLKKEDDQFYLVMGLTAALFQGQTKYEALVLQVGDKEIEVAARDPRLRPFYSGVQSEILLSIFESLIKIRAQEADGGLRCAAKLFEGRLYLTPDSLCFLPKFMLISLSVISYVEFSRINLSMAQAKTFDMTVFADKTYNFKGIQKDMFVKLEAYFSSHGVKMVSEVIEESESKSEYDSSSSNLSNMIDNGEEE